MPITEAFGIPLVDRDPSRQGAFVGLPHQQQSHADGDVKGPDLLLHLRTQLGCWDVDACHFLAPILEFCGKKGTSRGL